MALVEQKALVPVFFGNFSQKKRVNKLE